MPASWQMALMSAPEMRSGLGEGRGTLSLLADKKRKVKNVKIFLKAKIIFFSFIAKIFFFLLKTKTLFLLKTKIL